MQIIQAIILGIVQGLTEFIPVSSSGHLILMNSWLGFEGASLSFDVALHIGTLAALLWYFGHDFWRMGKSLLAKRGEKLAWYILLGTIPAVAAGYLLESLAESVFRSNSLVAFNLIWVALVMLAAEKVARHSYNLNNLGAGQALGVGLAQALAIVPGVSRSGSTITAGLLLGFDRLSATRFSFLLSAPVIAGAVLKTLMKGSTLSQISAEPALFIAGITASAISGYLAIRFLLKYLSKHSLAVFAYYRIAMGILILTVGL